MSAFVRGLTLEKKLSSVFCFAEELFFFDPDFG